MSKFSSDIENISQLLSDSRDRVSCSGDYEASINDHEQVIHLCTKSQRNCDSISIKKLELIKERCKNEITLLQQIVAEVNGLKKPSGSAHKRPNETKEDEDPDVWPPPTPNPRVAARSGGVGGNNNDNLPPWAKNNALQPSFPSRPEPSRRQSRETPPRNNDVPPNRRRYERVFTLLPAAFIISFLHILSE